MNQSTTSRDVTVVCRRCGHPLFSVLLAIRCLTRAAAATQPRHRRRSHLVHAPPIGAIDDVYKRIGLIEVVAPIWPDRFLTANVPDIQLEVIVHQAFDVESLSTDGTDIENCCFEKCSSIADKSRCMILMEYKQYHSLEILISLIIPPFAILAELIYKSGNYNHPGKRNLSNQATVTVKQNRWSIPYRDIWHLFGVISTGNI